MPVTDNTQRNNKIYLERLDGLTFKEIAQHNGMSTERARQIYRREAWRAETLQYKRLYNTRQHIIDLARAKDHINAVRKWKRQELTEDDKVLIEKLDSLISVYSE